MRRPGFTGPINPYIRDRVGSGVPGGTPHPGDRYYDYTNDRAYIGNSVNVWVCITPISASVATSESRSTNTFSDLTTVGPAVTMVTGTTVWITLGAYILPAQAGVGGYMGVKVTGASTISASTANAVYLNAGVTGDQAQISWGFPLTVTAGSNTFTAQYESTPNTFSTSFANRTMRVQDCR